MAKHTKHVIKLLLLCLPTLVALELLTACFIYVLKTSANSPNLWALRCHSPEIVELAKHEFAKALVRELGEATVAHLYGTRETHSKTLRHLVENSITEFECVSQSHYGHSRPQYCKAYVRCETPSGESLEALFDYYFYPMTERRLLLRGQDVELLYTYSFH